MFELQAGDAMTHRRNLVGSLRLVQVEHIHLSLTSHFYSYLRIKSTIQDFLVVQYCWPKSFCLIDLAWLMFKPCVFNIPDTEGMVAVSIAARSLTLCFGTLLFFAHSHPALIAPFYTLYRLLPCEVFTNLMIMSVIRRQ